MKVNELFYIGGGFIAGLLLSAFYFGGLWLTVKRLTKARYITLLFVVSYSVRIVISLCCIYFVAVYGNWMALSALLVGFIASRIALFKLKGFNNLNYRNLLKGER